MKPPEKNSAILHYFCSLPLVGYLNILITYSIHLFLFSSIEIVVANSANLCFLCILAVLSSLDHRKQLVQFKYTLQFAIFNCFPLS